MWFLYRTFLTYFVSYSIDKIKFMEFGIDTFRGDLWF